MYSNKIILLIITLVSFFACNLFENPKSKNSIQGVWQYIEDDQLNEIEGLSFFTDKHFAFVVNFSKDSSSFGQKVLAHSGTYSIQDSIVTATIQYSHNPAFIGQKLKWIHDEFNQNASYKVLDKVGNVVETGMVKRLE